MNIVLQKEDVNIDNIQFLDKKENIIMENGFFTKLIYSDSYMTMSGLYLYFPIRLKSIFQNKAFFDYSENAELIRSILLVEQNIIQYYKNIYHTTYSTFLSINKQFSTGKFKLNSFHNFYENKENGFSIYKPCIIKISGIWENSETMGITYKFLQCLI